MPRKVLYENIKEAINKPYHFVIGEDLHKTRVANFRDFPHLLVIGSTGGGKSTFLKQSIYHVLNHSDKIQVYILDLKGAGDFNFFKNLPNVRVSKEKTESIQYLKLIEKEMSHRFEMMSKNSQSKIDISQGQFDLIWIIVDESPELFKTLGNEKEDKEATRFATSLIDKIARKGRSAGIHLVLATQKMDHKNIPTSISENLTRRISFSSTSTASSINAFGSGAAKSILKIPGRALWQDESSTVEVQAPYLTDEILLKEVEELRQKWVLGKKDKNQKTLSLLGNETNRKDRFV